MKVKSKNIAVLKVDTVVGVVLLFVWFILSPPITKTIIVRETFLKCPFLLVFYSWHPQQCVFFFDASISFGKNKYLKSEELSKAEKVSFVKIQF